MRTVLFALWLFTAGASAQAALLTQGNIFAEGLAGCSVGVVVGLVGGTTLLSSPNPALGMATLAHIGVLGGCIAGIAIAVGMNGIAALYSVTENAFNRTGPIETWTTMVYPETPGAD
jgi:hypothetical protein